MGRRVTRASAKQAARGLPEELEDEVDKCTCTQEVSKNANGCVGIAADRGSCAVHKQRDYVPLESDGEEDSSEDGDEVLGLNSEDEEESEEDGSDEESGEEEEEDVPPTESKSMHKLARAERAMRERVLREQAGMSDEESEEEEEGQEAQDWGKGKGLYYGADNQDIELTDDEEAPQEEEEEALRIQRERAAMLRPEDFEEEEGSSSEDEEPMTLGQKAAVNLRKKGSKQTNGHVEQETIAKDKSGLTDQEKLSIVMSDAPELVGLLGELKKGLEQVRERIHPVIEKVKVGALATREGMSYLEAKNLLMLSYCTNIVFYLLLKSEGKSVRDHPVMQRLVQIRAYLEKIRPIDKKMQYQIEKLLKLSTADLSKAEAEKEKAEDPLQFRPNPEALLSKMEEAEAEEGAVYRPPKITPMAFEDQVEKKKRKEEKRLRDSKVQAARSNMIRELAAELEDRPEEHRTELAELDETGEGRRQKQFLNERAKAEEELFVRVPLNKEERKRLKAQKRSGLSTRFEDFRDDVADIVASTKSLDGPSDEGGSKRKRLSTLVRDADPFSSTKKKRPASGEADLPLKDSLGQRRLKYESRIAHPHVEEVEEPVERVEDETYQAAKSALHSKQAAKKETYGYKEMTSVPRVEERAEGKRKTTYEIEKNRGLTPHRKRDFKNPRKKHRLQHQKALVRRRGQVQDVRSSEGPYGGESTGIKRNVSKSVRL